MMFKKALLAVALMAPLAVNAGDWTGTGEFGLAFARGNAKAENMNARLNFAKEDAEWMYEAFAGGLRTKGETAAGYDLSANRYDLGYTQGRKLDELSYIFGALRYEHDDFSPYKYQGTFALGYGYHAIMTDITKLTFEVGPGWRKSKSRATLETNSEAILRGKMDYANKLTANTELFNVLLVEAGGDNTFAQNDFGVSVAMNEDFALKAGLQVRYNSDVTPGTKHTDTLSTLNLVYNFK